MASTLLTVLLNFYVCCLSLLQPASPPPRSSFVKFSEGRKKRAAAPDGLMCKGKIIEFALSVTFEIIPDQTLIIFYIIWLLYVQPNELCLLTGNHTLNFNWDNLLYLITVTSMKSGELLRGKARWQKSISIIPEMNVFEWLPNLTVWILHDKRILLLTVFVRISCSGNSLSLRFEVSTLTVDRRSEEGKKRSALLMTPETLY